MTNEEFVAAAKGKFLRGIEVTSDNCIVLRLVPNRMTRREQETRITIVAMGPRAKLIFGDVG